MGRQPPASDIAILIMIICPVQRERHNRALSSKHDVVPRHYPCEEWFTSEVRQEQV